MSPRCWFCDADFDADLIEHEGVLVPRATARGGPLWVLPCPECRTENGAERNAAGDFLLTPTERPALSDWLSTITNPRRVVRSAHARAWFRENAERRRAFHSVEPRPRPRSEPLEDPTPSPEPETEPERPHRPPPPDPGLLDAMLAHYRLLDLPLSATEKQVTAAYRRLSQKCHPDKVAHLDEEFQALAERKFKELRAAYEKILEGRVEGESPATGNDG